MHNICTKTQDDAKDATRLLNKDVYIA